MKQRRLKTILAFLLVLCVAFGTQANIVFAQDSDASDNTTNIASVKEVSTLDEFKDAVKDESVIEIKLINNNIKEMTLDEDITINRTLIIDLNGKAMSLKTFSITVDKGGLLTVKDSGEGGEIQSVKKGATGSIISVSNGGQMAIEGGTIKCAASNMGKRDVVSVIGDKSCLVFSGGTIDGGKNNITGISVKDGGSVEIKTNSEIKSYYGLSVGKNGSATIQGGNVITATTKGTSVWVNGENAKLIINDGTISSQAVNTTAVQLGKGYVEFNGGIIENKKGTQALYLTNGTFKINAGTIISDRGKAVNMSNNANFVMNGGSVDSKDLGIQTETYDNTTVTINKGTITAGTYALEGQGSFIIKPDNVNDVIVTGGEGIISKNHGVNDSNVISGGIFSHDISQYVADNSKSIAFASNGEESVTTYYVGADADKVIEEAKAGAKITALKNIETLNVNEGVLVVNNIDTTITVNGSEVKTGTDPVPATHNMTYHEAVQATCENTGTKEYYSCSICKKNFEDAEGNAEITETVTTPATGHDWSEPEWAWEADYNNATATFTCQNDTSHVEKVNATITFVTSKVATCTTKGEKVYTATVMLNKKEYTDIKKEEIVAVGHSFGDWETVKLPNCTDKGSQQHICDVCGFTETQDLDATGHDFFKEWKYDADNHWHECDCGEKANVAEHTFEWVIDKKATVNEAGSKHEECSICGYKESAVEIPKTGGNKNPTDTDKTTSDNPNTGDDANMTLGIVLFVLSGGLLAVNVGIKRKKESK